MVRQPRRRRLNSTLPPRSKLARGDEVGKSACVGETRQMLQKGMRHTRRMRRIGDKNRESELCSFDNASFNHSVLVWSGFSSNYQCVGP
jgi:hypothetical protein